MGRGGDGQHVVQAHDRVGDDDDPDGFPERASLPDVAFGAGLLANELEGDPEERQAADELEERDPQQERRDRDERQPQADRARGAPEAPPELLALRQRPDRQRDDEGVVAREREIDHDDPDDPRPELRIHQKDHTSLHQRLQDRDQNAAHHDESDSDSQTFIAIDRHLVSPRERTNGVRRRIAAWFRRRTG